MLAFMLAAQEPALIKKLILISSGPFEELYAAGIMETRLDRLSDAEKISAASLLKIVNNHEVHDKNRAFRQSGHLMAKADSYDPVFSNDEPREYQCDIHTKVWG